MADKFRRFEEFRARDAIVVIGVLRAIGVLLVPKWPSGDSRLVLGVVESSGRVTVGKYQGGIREESLVRLQNGDLVAVFSTTNLVPGQQLQLIEQPRLFVAPSYSTVSGPRDVSRRTFLTKPATISVVG